MLSRRTRIATLVASVIAVTLAAAGWLWFREHRFVECTAQETRLHDETFDRDVFVVENLCDGVASSDRVSIQLVGERGDRVSVLEYGAAYSFTKQASEVAPVVVWQSADLLAISIGKVAYVDRQVKDVDGTRIQVRIGEVVVK